jgi:hypothetical protein
MQGDLNFYTVIWLAARNPPCKAVLPRCEAVLRRSSRFSVSACCDKDHSANRGLGRKFPLSFERFSHELFHEHASQVSQSHRHDIRSTISRGSLLGGGVGGGNGRARTGPAL